MNLTGAAFRERLLPIALSQLVGVACGIAGVKVVSRIVEPALFGRYGVFLTFTTLGAWCIHAGLIRFIGRHWAGAENKRQLLTTTLRAWARKLLWLCLAACVAAVATSRFDITSVLALLAPLFFASSLLSVGAIAQTALQAERKNWSDFVVATGSSASRTFMPPLLLVALGSSAGLYLGFCLHAAYVACAGLWKLWPAKTNAASSQPEVKLSSDYDGPLFVALALANWSLTGVNRWIVAWAYGDVSAGLFTLASNISLIIPAVASAIFTQYFQPGFFEIADSALPDKQKLLAKRVDLVVAGFCLTVVCGLFLLWLVAPALVGPLIDSRYKLALDWLLPAACFSLTVVTGQFYHVMMVAAHKERSCLSVDLSAAAVLVAGCVASSQWSQDVFKWWLLLSPLTLLLVTRPIARYKLFKT